MKFEDKYISTDENNKKADTSKITLSNDAYAIGEMLQTLINKIEHAGLLLR